MKPCDVKKLVRLANQMCRTFDDLSYTSMARVAALDFAPYYRKKLDKILKPKKPSNKQK